MPSRQGIVTDQLINVIQVLQLGRKTGELRAERQNGPQSEFGLLKFVHGQVTFAQCGQLDGQSALHWLQSWGQCRFVFTNTTVEKNTGPLRHDHLSSPSSPLPKIKAQDSSPMPTLPAVTQMQSPNTGPMSSLSLATLVPRRMYSADEGMYRLQQVNPSRLHKHLYLLIDNQRSCAELVRIVNRQPEEVLQLLHDLERVGIIQLY